MFKLMKRGGFKLLAGSLDAHGRAGRHHVEAGQDLALPVDEEPGARTDRAELLVKSDVEGRR